MHYLVINQEKNLQKIIRYLIQKEGLPKIQNRLDIFEENGDFRVEILNNEVTYRKNERSKKIFVKNKNLKVFFKSLDNAKKYYINDISIFNFKNFNLLFDTYHGIIISSHDKKKVFEIKDIFKLSYYDNINKHKFKFLPKPQSLFDEIDNLNIIIKQYGLKVGLDIRSSSSSLRMRLSNISNDYTHIENYFKIITGQNLLTINNRNTKFTIKNMSIIIPVYNQNVVYTLLSIQGQNISQVEKKKIQVIIVDDGSKNNYINEINKIKSKLDFELQIIYIESNLGISSARNIGYSIAKYEYILFLDSDIILSKNYIYDLNIRTQLIPNAIFTCMRKNIEASSEILNFNNLLKGIETSTKFDDSRITTKVKDYHIGCNKNYINEEFSILDDTNYFKNLSYGSQIGIYNMSTVVAGHNIFLNKKLIKTPLAFDISFKGWGMEDACFASNVLAEGCYVIPVLSSCVYHINHIPRCGSSKQKKKEALNNYDIYNKLLDKEWN